MLEISAVAYGVPPGKRWWRPYLELSREWSSHCRSCTLNHKMASTPSIRISKHQRCHSPLIYAPFSVTSTVKFPRMQESAPPPLPPPSYIPDLGPSHDPGWQWGNDASGSEFGRPVAVKSGSSLLGSAPIGFKSEGQERDFYIHHASNSVRRGSSLSTVTLSREYDIMDTAGDDDGSVCRHTSNYRYAEYLDVRSIDCTKFLPLQAAK